MSCSHCGFSNDTSEHRCSRCGRPLQLRMGAHWRRSGLESDTPLASLPASGLSEPPPTRQPLWKQELNRKLEGYRDRQKQGEDERQVLTAQEVGTGHADNRVARAVEGRAQAEGQRAAAASAGASSNRLPPLRTQPVGPAGPKPQATRNWRRISPTTESPTLPPLGKPAAAAQTAKAQPESAPRAEMPRPQQQAAAPPRYDRDVAAAAPIAPLAIRAVAGVLDFSIIVVAVGIFLAVFYLMGGVALTDVEGLRSIAVAFLVIVCFYWVFYVGYLCGTSGMNWLGLRVLNFDGEAPSTGQRRTRALGTILSTLSLGLGFAWSIADEEKLTWHDRMSKTFVTRDGSIGFRSRAANHPAGKRLPELRTASRA